MGSLAQWVSRALPSNASRWEPEAAHFLALYSSLTPASVQVAADILDFAQDLLTLGLVADQYCLRSRCFERARLASAEGEIASLRPHMWKND